MNIFADELDTILRSKGGSKGSGLGQLYALLKPDSPNTIHRLEESRTDNEGGLAVLNPRQLELIEQHYQVIEAQIQRLHAALVAECTRAELHGRSKRFIMKRDRFRYEKEAVAEKAANDEAAPIANEVAQLLFRILTTDDHSQRQHDAHRIQTIVRTDNDEIPWLAHSQQDTTASIPDESPDEEFESAIQSYEQALLYVHMALEEPVHSDMRLGYFVMARALLRRSYARVKAISGPQNDQVAWMSTIKLTYASIPHEELRDDKPDADLD